MDKPRKRVKLRRMRRIKTVNHRSTCATAIAHSNLVKKEVVEQLNKRHCLVYLDKRYVLTKKLYKINSDYSVEFESKKAFFEAYAKDFVELPTGEKLTKAQIWWQSEDKVTYDGLQCKSPVQTLIPGYYNLYNKPSNLSKKYRKVYNIPAIDEVYGK